MDADTPESRAGHALLNEGPTAVILIDGGRISYANPAALRIASAIGVTGASGATDTPGAILGQPLSVFGPEIAEAIAKETGHATAQATETTIGSGPAARSVAVRTVPDASRPESIVLLIDECSTRTLCDSTLLERTAILEAVVESLPFDFWMNDLDNRTAIQNPISRQLWGEKYGTRMEDVQDDPEVAREWMRTNKLALSGEVQTGETIYTIEGEKREFYNIVGPVRDRDEVIGVFGVNIDISDYKRALRQRDLLLREMNHRVKNHLQMILSMIHLQRDPCPETEGRTFQQIEERIHAVLLVHDQLYEAEDLHSIDLGEYTLQLVVAVRSGYSNPIEFNRFDTPVPFEYHKAVPYGIVLTELINNAVRHGVEHQPVTIEFHCGPAEVAITVGNTIDPATFHSPAETPAGEGGFSIIASVVSQFSGELSFATESDTDRYCVTLRFPYPAQ